MSIWLQKSASIQRRTSPLKFDHFRYPKADFTASNLSTKAPAAGEKRKHEELKASTGGDDGDFVDLLSD